MERRINKKIEAYITAFKEDIKAKAEQLGLHNNSQLTSIVGFVYDYDRLVLCKEDFMKRKRVKNAVHLSDRCGAKRASCEQCTRRKKEGYEYCGTHLKGRPYGVLEAEPKSTDTKLEVWLEDINGVHQYTDKEGNIYSSEDILQKVTFPRIISKKKAPVAV